MRRWVALALLTWPGAALAQVGDPQLRTDDASFPGEGALSTPERALDFAMRSPRGTLGTSDRDRLIKLFLWRAETFSHNYSPAIYALPGQTPDPRAEDPLMTDYDAMRTLFSYGFGLCGTNHAHVRVFADALGWPQRRRGLVGDTGNEVFVDGQWRYLNTDQYTLHFLSDDPAAHFASLDQVVADPHRYIEWNPDLGLGYLLPQANTHGGYAPYQGRTRRVENRSAQWHDYVVNVWNIAPAESIALYAEGYTATPVVVALRPGETFTRFITPDGAVRALGLAGRLWWGFNSGGPDGGSPYTEWSFVQNAPARDQGAGGREASRGEQRYGNAVYAWTPDLASTDLLDGAHAVTGTFVRGSGSGSGGAPRLRASGAATLVIGQYTPYTIAGRPLTRNARGNLDPALPAADGARVTGDATGAIAVEVSTNAGATWRSIGALAGPDAALDFTDEVKGTNQYLLRLTFDDGEGLDRFALRTIGMLSPAVYPNLRAGGATIDYRASGLGALELSPDLRDATAAEAQSGYVVRVGDSGNVSPVYYRGEAFAYVSTNNRPLSLTYRITLPPALAARGARFSQIQAAMDANIRVPPPPGHRSQIEVGPTASGPWTRLADQTIPDDNELSHQWSYGRTPEGMPVGGDTYFVRFTHDNGGYTARIRNLEIAATHTLPGAAAPLTVDYRWSDGAPRQHAHVVAAGAANDRWTIPTGAAVVQESVALSLASAGAVTPVVDGGVTGPDAAAPGEDASAPRDDASAAEAGTAAGDAATGPAADAATSAASDAASSDAGTGARDATSGANAPTDLRVTGSCACTSTGGGGASGARALVFAMAALALALGRRRVAR